MPFGIRLNTLPTIMNKIPFIIFASLLVNFTCWGQIDSDTLFCQHAEIRVFTDLLEGDTIVKAYFDKKTPRHLKRVSTNFGKKKTDATFTKIAECVRLKFPKASVTATNIETGQFPKIKKLRNIYLSYAISIKNKAQ